MILLILIERFQTDSLIFILQPPINIYEYKYKNRYILIPYRLQLIDRPDQRSVQKYRQYHVRGDINILS